MKLNYHSNRASCKNVLLLCALVVVSVRAGYGQTTTGQPLTQPASGPATPSPLVLDATRFPGALGDVCAQINAAITQMNGTTNNGVVDARAFTGPLKCASNMFPSNASGKLLLGNVVLNVSVTQVQPSKFQVEGTGWAIAGTPSNTVIQACAAVSLPLCPSVLTGAGTLPPVLWCWGHGGSCSNGGNPGISFGSLTQFMSFDCSAVPGSGLL